MIKRTARIPGVFPSSVHYREQVLSTGTHSLDFFVGGGLPIGSLCLVRDTFPSRFSDCILKTFIAEGATYNHHLFTASGHVSAEDLLKTLPSLAVSKRNPDAENNLLTSALDGQMSSGSSADQMKIAWRYSHQQSPQSRNKETKFDFSRKATAASLGSTQENLTNCNVAYNVEGMDTSQRSSQMAVALLQNIYQVAERSFGLQSKTDDVGLRKEPTNILRISLSHCEDILSPQFMTGLRAILQNTNACALITVSDTAYGGYRSRLRMIEHVADYVICLLAVPDEKKRSELGDIDGICQIVKLHSLNSLKVLTPPRDLGFTFRKKRLVFHELSLPPEGESTVQREVSAVHHSSGGTGCGTTLKGKSIDF